VIIRENVGRMALFADLSADPRLTPKQQATLELVDARGAIRARDLEMIGLHHDHLRALERKGLLRRVSRGLYSRVTARPSHQDIIEASRRVPGGVICLLSALTIHHLTLQAPWEVWMAIHRKARLPKVSSPPVRLFRFPDAAYSEGIAEVLLDGVPIRTYSAPKTVVDCFRFQREVGLDVALEALANYRSSPGASVDDLWHFAKVDRVERKLRPYIEAIWR
jgi:predicted transcriptional regulator of viral defense system